MVKSERVRYQMFQRVVAFGAANGDRFPKSSTAGQVFAQVADAVARIDAHQKAKPLAALDGRATRVHARAAVQHALGAIVRTARALDFKAMGRENTFRIPRSTADDAVLATARLFIDEGEPVRDALVQLGLPPTWLQDLCEATDRFAQTCQGRLNGRRGVASAQEGIRQALALGFRAVRQLDVIVPNLLQGEHELLAGWRRDRRIITGQRKAEPEVTTPVAAPVTAPAPTPVTPAAPAADTAPAAAPPDEMRRAS